MSRFAIALSALLLAATSAPALSASYCVDTAAELKNALEAAAASDEADVIRVETGSITLADRVNLTVRGNLSLRGGYAAGCAAFTNTSSRSTIVGVITQSFVLNLRADDLSLLRLTFVGHALVGITDTAFASKAVSGSVLVQRVAVQSNLSGLYIVSDHHDVRVENSLFINQLNNGGSIFNGVGLSIERGFNTTAQVTVEVVNNTASANQYGFLFAVPLGGTEFVPRFDNNISYDNRVTDLVLRRPVRVAYSIWGTQDLSDGGSLSTGSGSNLNVDPQLDQTLRPIEPSSPAINSGRNTPSGGLPSTDYRGAQRLIGTRVDRGAYESAVNDSTTLTVTSTANSGAGTLRQAIIDANSTPGTKTIEFDITGACPRQITVTSALPALLESTTIAGYTQPGSVPNDDDRAFNGTLCVALLGDAAVATGLHFDTGAGEEMTVEGVAFFGFTSEAVKITGTGSGFVRGSTFGTGIASVIANPGFADAAIRVIGAPDSEIGGPDPAQRNVISRGAGAGVRLEASSARRSVRNNLIGFLTNGTAAAANGIGITVEGSFRDSIFENLVGFSTTQGVRILASGTPAQETTISNNDIGVSATFGDAGNGTNGVRIEGGSGHTVTANTFRNNGTDGLVVLTSSRRVRITNNSFANNALQAIDLSPDGVNPIDIDVDQTGANDQQNYPILTAALGTDDIGEVSGTLLSENGTYTIQFFRNFACDADGYGEAQTYIGQATVQITNATAGNNGSVSFTDDLVAPGGTLFDREVSAIAIDEEGNSSEVSACIPYEKGPLVFKDGFEGE